MAMLVRTRRQIQKIFRFAQSLITPTLKLSEWIPRSEIDFIKLLFGQTVAEQIFIPELRTKSKKTRQN
jgi:hypothetical protein